MSRRRTGTATGTDSRPSWQQSATVALDIGAGTRARS